MANCPYCGKIVKESDRFCLYCGEPLVKQQPEPKEPEPASDVVDGIRMGRASSTGSTQADQVSPAVSAEKIEVEPEGGKEKVREPITVLPAGSSSELDPAIKAQIEGRIEIYHLEKKIKKLKDRLAESLKLMDDPEFKKRYDNDDEFHKANEARFMALKQMGEALKAEKQAAEKKAGKETTLELNNMKIKRLKGQIEELNNNFKLRKIDKKTYDTLHGEYMIQLTETMKQRDIHNIQLGIWASALRAELEDLKLSLNLIKARHRAREISKEQMIQEKAETEKKIQTLAANIKIVEGFIFRE
ncbi:MAG: zinc ribbon domain-containing protein [Candidatus Sigynarchaeota archaeon]